MKVERAQVTTYTISGVQGLDPVTVFLNGAGPRWSVTVECYGQAWSTFFGNIGDGTIEDFLATCGGGRGDYLVNALIGGARHHMLHKRVAAQEAYLTRIVLAIREALSTGGPSK